MVNKSKNLGTAAETRVVRYLAANGFPYAERRALAGIKDLGDITGTPDIAWEVKAGQAAWNASDNQIDKWLVETEVERVNAKASVGILVVARRGKNPRDWWAVMTMRNHQLLLGHALTHPSLHLYPCRTTLSRAVEMLRHGGWGDPPEDLPPEGTPA